MRAVLLLSVLVLLSVGGHVKCVHIRDLQVPSHVAEGSEVRLGCKFDLEGLGLYSVKWLKDDQEFYSYKPVNSTNVPVAQAFTERGVSVDLARSSMTTVTLVFMTQESSGEYRCEVVSEAPKFKKISAKRHMSVDLLPKVGPQVTGLREYYNVNDPVELNCSSLGARPESQVKWLVNDAPAPVYYLRGPWYTRSAYRLDATDTTLELKFGVRSLHFLGGVMTIKCQASLPPLYRKEAVFRYQMLPRAKQGKLLETTTHHYVKTTEKPCSSTIKIEIRESLSDGAEFWGSSIITLFLCILLGALF